MAYRTLLLTLFTLTGFVTGFSQVQLNPQIGVNFTRLTEDPQNDLGGIITTEGKGGIVIGADLRLGKRFYIQPGVYVLGSKTVYKYQDSLFVDPTEISQYNGKLRGMAGYKIFDTNFKMRVMAGPSYNFQLSLNADNNPYFDKENFHKGYFNLDGGIGIDILFLTAEFGYSYGLSDVFDNHVFRNKPKYQTWYVTVGVLFGG